MVRYVLFLCVSAACLNSCKAAPEKKEHLGKADNKGSMQKKAGEMRPEISRQQLEEMAAAIRLMRETSTGAPDADEAVKAVRRVREFLKAWQPIGKNSDELTELLGEPTKSYIPSKKTKSERVPPYDKVMEYGFAGEWGTYLFIFYLKDGQIVHVDGSNA